MRTLKLLAILLLVATVSCCHPPFPRPQAHYAAVLTLTLAGPSSLGSAFVIYSNASGSILATAYHVVEGSDFIGVVYQGQPTKAKLIAVDKDADLALLAVPFSWPAATLATTQPEVGSQVTSIGPTPFHGTAVTQGIVATGVGSCWGDKAKACWLADLRIGPGFSGSPVVNQLGEVVGLVTAFAKALPHFAILVSAARIAKLIAKTLRHVATK